MQPDSRSSERADVVLRFLDWALFKIHNSRSVDGLMVVAPEAATVDRVETALHVIRDYDPVRYRRLVGDLKRIWVRTVPGTVARFLPSSRTCELEEQFVDDEATTPGLVASCIVHEATHARLFRIGIGYDEGVRERVERICLRRELAFARKVPGGIAGQWAEASLAALPDLSDAAFSARRHENYREMLLRLGVPRWLVGFLIAIGRWLDHRRARKKRLVAAADKHAQ